MQIQTSIWLYLIKMMLTFPFVLETVTVLLLPKTDFPVGNSPFNIAVGLFNADSNLDLAVANGNDADVSILLGNGDGTFMDQRLTDFPTRKCTFTVAVGLFNADSNLDLAVANFGDANVSILLGNGDGTFGPKTDFPVGNGPLSIAVGEFDNNS